MAFGVSDFQELVSLLRQHPEWQEELRRLLLSQEIVTLPDLVRELAEGRKQTDEVVRQLAQQQVQLTARVDDLAQQLQQLVARVEDLTVRLEQLTARVDDLAEQVQQIARRLEQLTAVVNSLVESLQRIGDDVAKMKEFYLEQRYYTRSPAYFSKIIRRARTVSYEELCRLLDDALDAGVLSVEERDDLMQTDVVVCGRLRASGEEVYLVVEVSWGIGREDLERAVGRARGFAKLGWRTVPVLAGSWVTAETREAARLEGAFVVLDGGVAVNTYSPEMT